MVAFIRINLHHLSTNSWILLFERVVFFGQGTYVEGIKEEVVLSPAHALSLIASGEGTKYFCRLLVLWFHPFSYCFYICFSHHALPISLLKRNLCCSCVSFYWVWWLLSSLPSSIACSSDVCYVCTWEPFDVSLFYSVIAEHRHVGSNNFNLLSSRSHTIFTLVIMSNFHMIKFCMFGLVFRS